MTREIRYLTNDLIERNVWDGWLVKSKNRRIYASSAFLDIFSPRWGALALEDGLAFMPVTWNRKFGIFYLFQPVFVQQLGCFYLDNSCSGILPLFIERISADFRFIDISMNEMNNYDHPDYNITERSNYILGLDKSYDLLMRRYNNNTSRNIIKASRLGLVLIKNLTPSDIIKLFISNNGKRYPNIRGIHYSRLQSLLERGLADGFIEIRAARAANGEVISAACFLKDFERYVYYFSANTVEGRKQGGMFFLIDGFIRQYAETEMLLDFNGSMNADVARFYRGFGAEQVCYRRLKVNRLMVPFNYLNR